jgi:type IV pilus assembly protein PilP
MLVKMIRITILLIAMAGLIACSDTPSPAPAAQVVKQKIATPAANAAVPAAPVATPGAAPGSKGAAVNGTQTDADATQAATENKDASAQQPERKSATDLIQASLQIAGSYNPKGRFNPFEPLFKEEPQKLEVVDQKGQREKRVPQTPLERIAISQLKLSAVIRAVSGNRGLVEDATGKGYVIGKGTFIGLNSGKVTRVEPDRIVIEEEVESILGDLVIQTTELKLQKPAGEL